MRERERERTNTNIWKAWISIFALEYPRRFSKTDYRCFQPMKYTKRSSYGTQMINIEQINIDNPFVSVVCVCVCRSVSFPSFYSFDCSYFVCAEITEKIRCVSISIESIFQLKRSIVQKKAHKRKIKHKYFAEREGRVGERESAAMKLVRHCIIIYVVDLTHTRTTKTLGQKSTHTHTQYNVTFEATAVAIAATATPNETHKSFKLYSNICT